MELKWEDVVDFLCNIHNLVEKGKISKEQYGAVWQEQERLRHLLKEELRQQARAKNPVPRWRFWRHYAVEVHINLDTLLTPTVAKEFLALTKGST